MKYFPAELKNELIIKDIVTVHYFEFSKDYRFVGESHDFWELVYVDRGRMNVYYDENKVILGAGDLIFHKPNEWHNLAADGETVGNVVIVSFISSSPGMKYFENRILKAGEMQKELLSKIISESRALFETPLDDPYTLHFKKREKHPFGSQQLIRLYLTEFLISIVRNEGRPIKSKFVENTANSLVNSVLEYFESKISGHMTVCEIEHFTHASRSAIEAAFRDTLGCGVISYFIKMKIEYAKVYIRRDNYNITQIADMLGYESIHYFSRQFKKVTGMSPKEYSLSIKAKNGM